MGGISVIVIMAFCSFGFFQQSRCSEISCTAKCIVSITQMVDPSRVSCPGFIEIIYVVNHRGNIEIGLFQFYLYRGWSNALFGCLETGRILV